MSQAIEPDAGRALAPSRPNAAGWWQRLIHGARRLLAPRRDWADFAGDDWPERVMHINVTDDLHSKQGRSTCRWTLDSGARQLVVYLKRHFELRRSDGLLAALWPQGDWSPAMQERRNLEWAQAHGLPVPNVVAAGEFLGPWGKLQSFLAIEELTDMLPLHEAIPIAARQLDPVAFRTWKAGLTREIARLARFLHDRNRFHKDLYLCHFFIRRADISQVPSWTNRVFMIDFHRLARHVVTHGFWQSKDLGQLLYSTDIPGIDARDRLRFWRAYMGAKRQTSYARLLRRVAVMRGRRYRDHNRKAADRKGQESGVRGRQSEVRSQESGVGNLRPPTSGF